MFDPTTRSAIAAVLPVIPLVESRALHLFITQLLDLVKKSCALEISERCH